MYLHSEMTIKKRFPKLSSSYSKTWELAQTESQLRTLVWGTFLLGSWSNSHSIRPTGTLHGTNVLFITGRIQDSARLVTMVLQKRKKVAYTNRFWEPQTIPWVTFGPRVLGSSIGSIIVACVLVCPSGSLVLWSIWLSSYSTLFHFRSCGSNSPPPCVCCPPPPVICPPTPVVCLPLSSYFHPKTK